MSFARPALILAALVLVGCGEVGPSYPAAKLAGSVTIDEQPVANGTVQFMPETPAAGSAVQPVSAPIQDGRYLADAVPKGKVRVLFTAQRKTGKMITEYSTPYEEVVSIVPKKYQEGITLDVAADKQDQNFDLRSR
jgi:hypothetical protein